MKKKQTNTRVSATGIYSIYGDSSETKFSMSLQYLRFPFAPVIRVSNVFIVELKSALCSAGPTKEMFVLK